MYLSVSYEYKKIIYLRNKNEYNSRCELFDNICQFKIIQKKREYIKKHKFIIIKSKYV
jgi:hypothetical protein